MSKKKPLNVTQSHLPPIQSYTEILQESWDAGWITNRGALVKELEEKLKEYLGVKHLVLTANGTLPITMAIKALELTGEIITTPFSYVATTSSIVWENCKPIFVDIDPNYYTIDEDKIEDAINENTSGILATHVYGNPCEVDKINEIANKHNLKVIYDAAHCFGVKYKGQSILNYGDISTCSFHATKIFHTGEGGCWVTNSDELNQKMYYYHNFGHKTAVDFETVGINAKLSELQAALGLAVFNDIDTIISNRKKAVERYNEHFEPVSDLSTIKIRNNTEWNYHYYPITFTSEKVLLNVLDRLRTLDIFPRRYFYPSLNTLDYLKYQSMPISEDISARVLCLPLSAEISMPEVDFVAKSVIESL